MFSPSGSFCVGYYWHAMFQFYLWICSVGGWYFNTFYKFLTVCTSPTHTPHTHKHTPHTPHTHTHTHRRMSCAWIVNTFLMIGPTSILKQIGNQTLKGRPSDFLIINQKSNNCFVQNSRTAWQLKMIILFLFVCLFVSQTICLRLLMML